jgi:hypothetical protein
LANWFAVGAAPRICDRRLLVIPLVDTVSTPLKTCSLAKLAGISIGTFVLKL